MRTKREHDVVPSVAVLQERFPDMRFPKVSTSDIPLILQNLKQRRKFREFLSALNEAASTAQSYETVDDSILTLQSQINSLSMQGATKSSLVDLFSASTNRAMEAELLSRRSGAGTIGIPTGLTKFDRIVGGLQSQKMTTVIGRTSSGKSWIDLLFVASAVMNGHKVMLYPLEMTLVETAFRLYTLFSQRMFGAQRVLKNYDLTTGKVTTRKLVKFLEALEDKFAGQLLVADVAALSDPYTTHRIEAEVELHQPEMFWVDYLTLLKLPGSGGLEDWSAVRSLSNSIKNIAMRRNCVGGCSAQVNREAVRNNVFLPRLEHISYADAIGQDSDLVFSINKDKNFLYYALVKNRGGPEIGKTKLRFVFDEGRVEEMPDEVEE